MTCDVQGSRLEESVCDPYFAALLLAEGRELLGLELEALLCRLLRRRLRGQSRRLLTFLGPGASDPNRPRRAPLAEMVEEVRQRAKEPISSTWGPVMCSASFGYLCYRTRIVGQSGGA